MWDPGPPVLLPFLFLFSCRMRTCFSEGWRVNVEKSHSKSVNRFIYKQVWDLISISRILGCCSCDTRFRYYTCVGGHGIFLDGLDVK